ncbi:hypothetical protein [Synechococcus sp. GFB01]|uniref:hypothetical protein n=1 Tax=Synechococcus sp. GFB01 TaxID=1662190 RepID=UPI00064F8B73|nr:hypothetical protein [Synechococcus sp. GFB01]KMM16598.1 hypothetical protein SYNGFB01_10075 [Synechococcus sp. GFB01]
MFSWTQQSGREQQLQKELQAARDELEAMQGLLSDLPEIFERKFQSRLEPILEQQHRLLEDNAALRQQLLQIQPQQGSQERRLLMPGPETSDCDAPRGQGLRHTLKRLLPWSRSAGADADAAPDQESDGHSGRHSGRLVA